ncbi:uncharacterized protein LOC132196839 [Neocloeon triangulifer]|uniref:uncharacterized protein LOC132196839 n=1 Tax=Neocloeon triangulifer TaxID=2078957 RepID=UPI00286F94E3|nr:uncharacterized protein LOC132196839 [Neocloeon triangulifer]
MMRLLFLLFGFLVALTNCEWIQLPQVNTANVDLNPQPSKTSKSDQTPFSNLTIDPYYISSLQTLHQQLRDSIWLKKEEPRTMQEKITYLNLLKNRMLRFIAEKLVSLNIEGKRSSRRRFARDPGWSQSSGNDIGFPSLEVALLTLSFLVFAVFVVNMVLVLFSNIFGTTTTTGTGTTAGALGRRRRSLGGSDSEEKFDEAARILKALEEFPFKRDNSLNHHCSVDDFGGCGGSETPIPQIARFLLKMKL